MVIGILRMYKDKKQGIEYYNSQEIGFAKALAQKNNQVNIFYMGNKKLEEIEISKNVKIIYIPSKSIGHHGFFRLSILKQYNIDLIHLCVDNQLFTPFLVKWCERNKIKIIGYFGTVETKSENILKKLFTQILIRINIKMLNRNINFCKNEDIKNKLILLGLYNIQILPVGLDIDVFNKYTDEDKAFILNKYKLFNKKIILFIARMEKNKNPLFALELIKSMVEIDERYHLVMIGKGSLQNDISNSIKHKNLIDDVTYIESIKNSDISIFYNISECFINLCKDEIYGMCILESFYNKCSVVAVNAPGPNFLIKNNLYGYIIDDLNIKSFIDVIISIDKTITSKAHTYLLENLTWDQIVTKVYLKYLTAH